MLNKNHMNMVCVPELCYSLGTGDGQRIREALLRSAVRYCDNYATDILILLQGETVNRMFINDNYEVDVYFRSGGIDWVDSEGFGTVPELYRRCMKLVKEDDKISLYETYGNC